MSKHVLETFCKRKHKTQLAQMHDINVCCFHASCMYLIFFNVHSFQQTLRVDYNILGIVFCLTSLKVIIISFNSKNLHIVSFAR